MKPWLFSFSLLCAVLANAQEIEQDLRLNILPTGEKTLEWQGYEGRSYFFQSSPDLKNWTWAPNIETGIDAPMSYEVESSTDKGFFRLQYTDQSPLSSDLEDEDFDGDGLTNQEEITPRNNPRVINSATVGATNTQIQTDPLNYDTDGDGLSDGWEQKNGHDPTNSDENGNGIPDGQDDNDNDGIDNGTEVDSGANPDDSQDFPIQVLKLTHSVQGYANSVETDIELEFRSIYMLSSWTPSIFNDPTWITTMDITDKSYLKDQLDNDSFPTSENISPSYFQKYPLQSADLSLSGDSYKTEDSEQNYIAESRIWINAPAAPIERRFSFLRIRKITITSFNPNLVTESSFVLDIVNLVIPANSNYSNYCDIKPDAAVIQGCSIRTIDRLVPLALNCNELYMFCSHPGDKVSLCNISGITCQWRLADETKSIGFFNNPTDTGSNFIATSKGKNTIQLLINGSVVWEKNVEVLDLKSRSDWGAFAVDMSGMSGTMDIQGVTYHHSSSSNDGISEIQRIQRQHQARGEYFFIHENWGDIGYHFIMDKQGTVYTGRELEAAPGVSGGPYTKGSTVKLKNSISGIAICMLGNYEDETFTSGAQKNLEKAISAICRRYNLKSDIVSYHSERALTTPILEFTECPGAHVIGKATEIKNHIQENLR